MTVALARPATDRRTHLGVGFGVGAAVLYNVWLLGFALDPSALHSSYVSALEVPGRPFAHFFIACDVLTGVLAAVAGLLASRIDRVAGAFIVLFGAGNIFEATIPITARCADTVSACGTGVRAVLSTHDLASSASMLGLGLALLVTRRRSRWITGVFAAWLACLLFMGFSILTNLLVMTSQGCFLGCCGVVVVSVLWVLARDDAEQR